MATVINERDLILQGVSPRFVSPSDRKLFLAASSKVFQVPVSGVGAPASITLTASLANMPGTVTWSTVPTTTLTGSGNTRSLAFADLIGTTPVAITATLILDGVTHTATETISKVFDGAAGTAGLQSALVYAYQRSASVLTSNPGGVTFTFATGSITTPAIDALSNGWTKTIPAGTNPLYVTIASASATTATDTIAGAEFSTPVVLASDGLAGLNSATVYIFKRGATSTPPTLPSATTTYTFATGVLTGLNNGWTQAVPAATGDAYLFVSTATAAQTTATDTITSGEWAAAQILAQDGLSAGALALVSDAQAFTFDGAGTALPSSQTITFDAIMSGEVSGTASFTCSRYNSAGSLLGSVTMGGSGNTRTLTNAQFSTAHHAVIEITEDGYTDTMTVVRLQAGADALVGYLTNESHGVPASEAGVVSSYTGAGGTFKVYLGLVDVTTSCTFSTVGSPLVTHSIGASTGVYSVTASGTWTNGSLSTLVTYRATYGSVTIDKVFTLTKNVAGAVGASGVRGSRMFYLSPYTSWDSSAATTAASVDGGPILSDAVTEYSAATGFSQMRSWNGSSWITVTQVIDGNLLVTGTVSSAAFVAASFTGYTFTGAIFQTAASGKRVVIDSVSNELQVYSSSGSAIATLGGSAGALYVESASGSNPTIFGVSTDPSLTLLAPAGVTGFGDGHNGVFGASDQQHGVLAHSGSATYAALQAKNSAGGPGLGVDGDSVLKAVYPLTTNTYANGTASLAWSNIYSQNALTVTSDRRAKKFVRDSDLGLAFIKKLRPRSYLVKKGARRHYGFIAQEVKEALGDNDAAIWTLADKEDALSAQALRYEEIIAPLVRAVQELSAKVDALTKASK